MKKSYHEIMKCQVIRTFVLGSGAEEEERHARCAKWPLAKATAATTQYGASISKQMCQAVQEHIEEHSLGADDSCRL
jgi:hypothetical protein